MRSCARAASCGSSTATSCAPPAPRPSSSSSRASRPRPAASSTAPRERAEALLGDPAPAGVTVSSRTAHGAAVHRLVEASEDARLVVLERRDLSRVRRAVTRSTTSGVAARAHVPVVVVPPRWTPEAADGGPVTVAVDDAASASPVLRAALDQARTAGTVLRVVHAWWFPTAYEDLSVDPVAAAEWTERARHEIEEALAGPRAEYPDVPVEIDVSHGRPADLLLEHARHSALLVVGRHDPMVPLGSHLGPVARTVLREAACPVLVVAPAESRHHGRRAAAPAGRFARLTEPVATATVAACPPTTRRSGSGSSPAPPPTSGRAPGASDVVTPWSWCRSRRPSRRSASATAGSRWSLARLPGRPHRPALHPALRGAGGRGRRPGARGRGDRCRRGGAPRRPRRRAAGAPPPVGLDAVGRPARRGPR